MNAQQVILVVEDDRDNRDILIEILRDTGYLAQGATNGRDERDVHDASHRSCDAAQRSPDLGWQRVVVGRGTDARSHEHWVHGGLGAQDDR